MISDNLYLMLERLDERDRRKILRLIRRQLRFISRRRILKTLIS